MALNQMKMLNDLRKAQKDLAKEIVEVEAGDGAVVVDPDHVAELAHEVAVVAAVMPGALAEDRVGAFGEGGEVLLPEVIAVEVDPVQLALGHLGEVGSHGRGEDVELGSQHGKSRWMEKENPAERRGWV